MVAPGRRAIPRFDEPEQHPSLPLRAALGALAVLMVSLVLGKVIVEALVSYDWPLIVYIAISVVLSYGPSVVWGIYVRRRWGAGRLVSLGWKFRWSDLGWGPLTWLAAVAVAVGAGGRRADLRHPAQQQRRRNRRPRRRPRAT